MTALAKVNGTMGKYDVKTSGGRRRFSVLRWLIEIDGYRVAGFFLLALAFGAHINPNNMVFLNIVEAVPWLVPGVWEYGFLACAVFMFTTKSTRRWEIERVLIFFVFPVSTFYLMLVTRATLRMSYFTGILSILAVVISVLFVLRTAAINYIQTENIALATANKQYKEDADRREIDYRQLKNQYDKLVIERDRLAGVESGHIGSD